MKYVNPVIRGFNPDPSICRVGGDYYLVTSSFEYFPGIPIYHSTDLLNWQLVGHCITRKDQLPMEGVKASGGIWAPTIRYNNGRFYVTATFNERGNFIVYTDNPLGEWSNPIWTDMDGIDPSIFFENEKMYYCANDCGSRGENGEGISLAEINPKTGKVKGEIKRIWAGDGGGFLEAPHIYHIGKWYYLLAAEGGTGFGHMEIAARSSALFGEYKSCSDNPILTNRHDTSKLIGCSGHSDLIEDTDGNWWIVHLAIRRDCGTMSSIGRETFLTPVVWENDWMVVKNNRKATIDVDVKINAVQRLSNEWKADFNSSIWEKEWLFLRKPYFENYERKNGCLYLKPTTVKITNESISPTFAAVRKEEINFISETELEFDTKEIGDEAGLVIYLSPEYHYRICKKKEADGDYILIEKTADDFRETAFKEKIENGRLKFRIIGDNDVYKFYYGLNGEEAKYLCSAKTKFITCSLAGKSFTGTLIGLYAQSDEKTQDFVRVYNFSMLYNR